MGKGTNPYFKSSKHSVVDSIQILIDSLCISKEILDNIGSIDNWDKELKSIKKSIAKSLNLSLDMDTVYKRQKGLRG